jgi:hypothetical protein
LRADDLAPSTWSAAERVATDRLLADR